MSVDRGFTWMDDETLALIGIFSKDDIQQELNGSKRNIGVYERIAAELAEVGFRRTAYQCREKIKRLRKEYHSSKHCIENNVVPKKPIKYFELVDKIFNRDSFSHISNVDLNILSSDHEDELHLTFNHEPESDASNSCATIELIDSQNVPLGASCSPQADRDTNSPTMCKNKQKDLPTENHNDSEDVSVLSSAQMYDLSDKDSPLDENESPWVPNVVLIENDSESIGLENNIDAHRDDNAVFNEDDRLQDFHDVSQSETFFKEDAGNPWTPDVVLVEEDAPTALFENQSSASTSSNNENLCVTGRKKRKLSSQMTLFKYMMDSLTLKFMKYQSEFDKKILNKIEELENERSAMDERIQKLWADFEEKRRADEKEHELNIMTAFQDIINESKVNEA